MCCRYKRLHHQCWVPRRLLIQELLNCAHLTGLFCPFFLRHKYCRYIYALNSRNNIFDKSLLREASNSEQLMQPPRTDALPMYYKVRQQIIQSLAEQNRLVCYHVSLEIRPGLIFLTSKRGIKSYFRGMSSTILPRSGSINSPIRRSP